MTLDEVPSSFRRNSALIRSAAVRREYGLLVNDSLVVASALEAGIDSLASADGDFRRVTDLKLFQPSDLE